MCNGRCRMKDVKNGTIEVIKPRSYGEKLRLMCRLSDRGEYRWRPCELYT